eukprot:scaffold388_cov380-Prasinococcus_capsulatus_cf.AAC.25
MSTVGFSQVACLETVLAQLRAHPASEDQQSPDEVGRLQQALRSLADGHVVVSRTPEQQLQALSDTTEEPLAAPPASCRSEGPADRSLPAASSTAPSVAPASRSQDEGCAYTIQQQSPNAQETAVRGNQPQGHGGGHPHDTHHHARQPPPSDGADATDPAGTDVRADATADDADARAGAREDRRQRSLEEQDAVERVLATVRGEVASQLQQQAFRPLKAALATLAQATQQLQQQPARSQVWSGSAKDNDLAANEREPPPQPPPSLQVEHGAGAGDADGEPLDATAPRSGQRRLPKPQKRLDVMAEVTAPRRGEEEPRLLREHTEVRRGLA